MSQNEGGQKKQKKEEGKRREKKGKEGKRREKKGKEGKRREKIKNKRKSHLCAPQSLFGGVEGVPRNSSPRSAVEDVSPPLFCYGKG